MSRPLSISLQKARAVERESRPSFRRLLRSILSVLLDIEQNLRESQANKPKDLSAAARLNDKFYVDPKTQLLEKR